MGGYNETILDHFRNPRNVGEMQDADIRTTEGSPACGDQITLYLKVDAATKRIDDVKFQSYGCASNIATGSVITEMVKGKTLDEAKALTWQSANERLGGLPPVKVHCAVLAVEALHAAVEKYEVEHGLAKSVEPTTPENALHRLKKVIDPTSGKDVVSAGLVSGIDISSGTVTVNVGLPERHQFAANLCQEISEKLEFLPDVKKVLVVFRPDGQGGA
jgi:NifU-like protein involved in Fe-S cluster formation